MVNNPEDIGRTESNASGYEPLGERFNPIIDDFIIKDRRYAHFDCPLSEGQRSSFSLNDINLSSHDFWPLLAFGIPRRKRVYDSYGEFCGFISKPRPIKFGSHQDAAILQLYARELGNKYESYLSNKDYKNSVLAYRKIWATM
ncbi:MAG: hypothetical protein ABJN69_04625 [Hellea sp.]